MTLRARNTAPRLKTIKERLNKLACTAAALSDELWNLDYESHSRIWANGGFRNNEDLRDALMNAESHSFLDFLDELAAASSAAASVIQDVGGGNARPFFGTHPEREVAPGCLELFERYQPGKASRSASSPFGHFVSLVWEMATGERDASLEKPIRNALEARKRGRKPAGTDPP